jgi:hypothetical protein
VRGAGGLYAAALLRITHLSPAGAAQLAADAEYFCNVMAALAVPPPASLMTAQLFAGTPGDASWAQLADGALAAGSADAKVCLCVQHTKVCLCVQHTCTQAVCMCVGCVCGASAVTTHVSCMYVHWVAL